MFCTPIQMGQGYTLATFTRITNRITHPIPRTEMFSVFFVKNKKFQKKVDICVVMVYNVYK